MALTIPATPSRFHPEIPPPGFRNWWVTFTEQRPIIRPRLQLAHTNGAKTEGSIESSRNWSERRTYNGKATALPHFQIDRDGDAAMLLPLNRQPICNAKANPFSIAYETADRGWATDPYPTGSWFTEAQVQKLATGFAYCSILYGIPLNYPGSWDGWGSACHTEPFAYPYWTTDPTKPCPGLRKKQQVREQVLPHARAIKAAWTSTPPPPAKWPANEPQTAEAWRVYGRTLPTPPAVPVLQHGVIHSNVTWWQAVFAGMTDPAGRPYFNPEWIAYDHISTGPVTRGLFGDASRDYCARFQTYRRLNVDGVYGPVTEAEVRRVRGK